MKKRLQRRFVLISTVAVALVMVLLTGIINVAYAYSVNQDLEDTLTMIYENQGTIPTNNTPADNTPADSTPPADNEPLGNNEPGMDNNNPANNNEPPKRDNNSPFNDETPYSTRYFVLRYTEEGSLTQADLGNIASVTESNVDEYLEVAVNHGEGYGYYDTYKYYVIHTGDDRNMAIFVDAYQEIRSLRNVALWSLVAGAACIVLVFILVLIFSGKAIEPYVKNAEKQKQFITDASHELKTPISVIMTSLKLLEMDVGKQKWIDKAKAQTEKLKELVNELVSLAKMDEEKPLVKENFDLSKVIEDTAYSFEDYAKANGHEMKTDIEEGIRYLGNEEGITRLVSILLDNAVKYANPQSTITVSLKRKRKKILLETRNETEPLSKEDLKRIFDRFYRSDPSRNERTGGYGIGLAMAKEIANAHGGSIEAFMQGNEIVFKTELKGR